MALAMVNRTGVRAAAPKAREFDDVSTAELWRKLNGYLDKWRASTERACAAAEKGLESAAGAARSHFEEIVDQTCDRAFEISARDCIKELKRRQVKPSHA